MEMITAQILRVFTDETKNFGNPVSIVIDEAKHISDQQRQAITRQLGHDETVFINDIASATVNIFNPQQEVKFAGHALVGTAWLLARLNKKPVDVIHCLGGDITTWIEDDLTWISASLDMMPPWHIKQLETVYDVEKITQEGTAEMEHTMVWSWIDEKKGLIRARTFANDWDIPEAEGNGSGSMILAVTLNRDIKIHHGKGSVIFVRPAVNNMAELGGRVVEDKKISLQF